MPGIHSITAFIDDRETAEILAQYENRDVSWPITVWINTAGSHLHLHMSHRQFINLKNSILSLDRQIEEERKQDA